MAATQEAREQGGDDMAGPSKHKQGTRRLQCNACGHRFKGPVALVSTQTAGRGTVEWTPRQPRGVPCPACGSLRTRLPR